MLQIRIEGGMALKDSPRLTVIADLLAEAIDTVARRPELVGGWDWYSVRVSNEEGGAVEATDMTSAAAID
jgi:hypothetical protein